MSESLYAIDVYSLVYQVFHAIPPMTSPSGQPTNAVFGFTRDLLTIIKQKKPTYLVCAIDLSGPGVRDEIYEEYKANRSEMPDDLRPQIAVIVEVMESFGVPNDETLRKSTSRLGSRGTKPHLPTSRLGSCGTNP